MIMTEEIRPALAPEEWKHRRSGAVSLDTAGIEEYVVIEGTEGETVKVSGVEDIFALISLANDALPETDPRKITHAWLSRVEAIRDLILAGAVQGDPGLTPYRRELASAWDQMSSVLRAILPPERHEF